MSRFQTSGDKLKEILKVMDLCKNTIKITFSKDGMLFSSMDPSRVTLLRGTIKPTAFDDYQGDDEDVFIDMKGFESILKRVKKNAATLKVIGSEIEVTEKNTTWKVSQLREDVSPPTPKFSPANDCIMAADQFSEELSRVLDEGDYITMHLNKDTLTISCNTDAKRNIISTKIPLDELKGMNRGTDEAKSSYENTFFKNVIKDIPKGCLIDIGLDTDYPLSLRIFDESGTYDIYYYIAPRIEQEE